MPERLARPEPGWPRRFASRTHHGWRVCRNVITACWVLRRRRGTDRIIIGAGGERRDGWLATERYMLDISDEKSWARWFNPSTLSAILAEHVWEHLDQSDGLRAARLCQRYLAEDGYIRVAVPDGLHPDPVYREWVRPAGNGPGAADHRILYTYRSLAELFVTAGLDVTLLEYFDESGAFHRKTLDPADGFVKRSALADPRNQSGRLAYTSIILDARKSPLHRR
jgi:predicted SAM-dependent methyltransferase